MGFEEAGNCVKPGNRGTAAFFNDLKRISELRFRFDPPINELRVCYNFAEAAVMGISQWLAG
jgi:hypothetical protein